MSPRRNSPVAALDHPPAGTAPPTNPPVRTRAASFDDCPTTTFVRPTPAVPPAAPSQEVPPQAKTQVLYASALDPRRRGKPTATFVRPPVAHPPAAVSEAGPPKTQVLHASALDPLRGREPSTIVRLPPAACEVPLATPPEPIPPHAPSPSTAPFTPSTAPTPWTTERKLLIVNLVLALVAVIELFIL